MDGQVVADWWRKGLRNLIAATWGILVLLSSLWSAAIAQAPLTTVEQSPSNSRSSTQVLIFVGPSDHPAGTHEVAAGARLLQYALSHCTAAEPIEALIADEWPDEAVLRQFDCFVFTGDRFPLAEAEDSQTKLDSMQRQIDRGCGIVCYHYATGLTAGQVTEDGDHPLLRWLGGYFATACPHHKSIARIFPAATIELTQPAHPTARGVQEFTLHDEPYIENYFGPNGLQLPTVAVATSQLPPEKPKTQTVAWAVERADGGRGFGVVMPHFYRNWGDEQLRKLIVNAVVWCGGQDVPEGGIESEILDLSAYEPESVEPRR